MVESLATADRRSDPDERLASESLACGTRLGRYELLVPIAVGGMARVWAARLHGQRGFTKLVAIKTVLPHLACDPEFERMLVDEARIASGTRHPNVCEIYDLGEERGVVYIAMEWVAGDSLAQVLRGGGAPAPIDPRVAARIVSDAAAGLHAAHNLTDENGNPLEVVHRDVSPHNLLVSLDGNVKVTDFGVAKAIGASHEKTASGQLKGKVAYMAPEQAMGAPIDRRSDVFSLGCVLYEATTGKQPFRGEGEHHVLQELVKGSFLPPSRVVRGYPFELERIVVRALAGTPLHRYPTMEQMRIALEDWLSRSGSVVTQANVAAVVRERIGAEMEKRRERIRLASQASAERGEGPALVTPPGSAALAQRTPSGVSGSMPPPAPGRESQAPLAEIPTARAFPPVMAPTPPAPPPARGPSATQYVTAASLGVLAAVALAAMGVWVWSSSRPSVAAATIAAQVAEPAVREPVTLPIVPAAATRVAPAPPSPILFKIVPDRAFLVVDGAPLDPSVRAIARPTAGASERVIVRADGFEEQTLVVDEAAPASVDVWLNAVAPGPSAKKVSAPAKEPLPANPY